ATAGTPQIGGSLNVPFATQFQAKVAAPGGAAVSNVIVYFTAPSSGASGTFLGGGTENSAVTNASGIATAAVFYANGTMGSYVVAATTSGVAYPANFNLSNGYPLTITANNTATIYGAPLPA